MGFFEFIKLNRKIDLFEFLNNELPKVDDAIPEINCGGCGAFALYLSRELSRLDINHSIVWIGMYEGYKKRPNPEKIIHSVFKNIGRDVNVTHFHENGIGLSHIMIEINGYLVDSTGVYCDLYDAGWDNRKELTTISQEQLELIVNDYRGWNDWFNRENMPKLEQRIKRTMNKIKR